MSKGIDVRATTAELLLRALLQDGSGNLVTAGTTSLYLYEVQMSDGTLKSYDFSSNTFKATTVTTETVAMTHRTGNNGATSTGIWTYRLATLTGFTAGNVYLARVKNTGAFPADQVREFQFGSEQGDLVITPGGYVTGVLADAAHGGTAATLRLGSSTSTPALYVTSSGGHATMFDSTGAASGSGLYVGNASGNAAWAVEPRGLGHGASIGGGFAGGNAVNIAAYDGHGVNVAAGGVSRHGLLVTGGEGGTSDGAKFVAGAGGVPIRGDLTGNITGNLVGTVSALAPAERTSIADVTLRRHMASVEASADGEGLDKTSLYGMIQRTSKATAAGTTLTVYKTDGTTVLGTFTLTVTVGANPFTAIS